MFVDPRLREAELAFLNAPFVDDGWLAAVRAMADVTGSHIGQLCGIAGTMKLPINILSEDPHDPHRHLHNPVLYGSENWRIAVSEGVMRVRHDAHYAAYRSHAPTSFYDDAMSDLDVPHGCQTALSARGEDMLGLALLRSKREGPCSGEQLAQFSQLAWHAQRSMRVQLALGQEGAEVMLGTLSCQNEATMLLDRYGQLLAMTEAAEQLLSCPMAIRLDGLNIALVDLDEDRSFKAAISRLLSGDRLTGPVLHEARVGRCEQKPAGWWRLLLSRLPGEDKGLGLSPHLALTLRPVE